MPKWEYSGDINILSYGGVFMRHIADRRFHAIKFDNMDEQCGEDNADQPTYYGSLVEINLDETDVASAIKSCGQEDEDNSDLAIAFMVAQCGGYAPLHDEAGDNGNRVIRDLKRLSVELEHDTERHEALMERPVNALGSTAREYARNDFDSAIDRKLQQGDPMAAVMAKMQRPRKVIQTALLTPDGLVGEVSIDVSLTGSSDPLAFGFGFGQALRGTPISTEDDLADEYVRGHAEGTKARESGVLPPYARK